MRSGGRPAHGRPDRHIANMTLRLTTGAPTAIGARLESSPAPAQAAIDRAVFDAIVNSARDAVVVADDAGLVLFWNPAAEELFGYAASEIIGRPVTDLMPERYRAAHRAGLARLALT